MNKYTKVLGLCESRHPMPESVQGYVFPQEIKDPTDTGYLYQLAEQSLKDCNSAIIYVTGLTVALGAVVSYCVLHGIGLTLMHFDRETGEYFSQFLFNSERIGV